MVTAGFAIAQTEASDGAATIADESGKLRAADVCAIEEIQKLTAFQLTSANSSA
ncbi:hypothetical protein SEA_CALM_34 [Mycobacterium phage Calm]|nr:hypothetical protein SEA_ZARIA_34 [Mycobacterium phage Zaria]WMI34629.1 hypothetical protein SEA_CALM_34 [Mycobacterium phage Calm]